MESGTTANSQTVEVRCAVVVARAVACLNCGRSSPEILVDDRREL